MISITNSIGLKENLQLLLDNKEDKNIYNEVISAMYKYKWYNFYQNTHIKAGSPEDIENEKIFKDIEDNYPEIHIEVEQLIDNEIDRIDNED